MNEAQLRDSEADKRLAQFIEWCERHVLTPEEIRQTRTIAFIHALLRSWEREQKAHTNATH